MHIFCFQCYRKNPPKNETLDHYLQLRKCLTQVIWWVKQRVCRLRVGFFVVCFSVVVKSLKSTRRERVENPKKTVVKRIREVSPNWSKHSGPYWAIASMGLVYYIPTFTKIYHKNQPNVGKYIMHGLYGYYHISPVTCGFSPEKLGFPDSFLAAGFPYSIPTKWVGRQIQLKVYNKLPRVIWGQKTIQWDVFSVPKWGAFRTPESSKSPRGLGYIFCEVLGDLFHLSSVRVGIWFLSFV